MGSPVRVTAAQKCVRKRLLTFLAADLQNVVLEGDGTDLAAAGGGGLIEDLEVGSVEFVDDFVQLLAAVNTDGDMGKAGTVGILLLIDDLGLGHQLQTGAVAHVHDVGIILVLLFVVGKSYLGAKIILKELSCAFQILDKQSSISNVHFLPP